MPANAQEYSSTPMPRARCAKGSRALIYAWQVGKKPVSPAPETIMPATTDQMPAPLPSRNMPAAVNSSDSRMMRR